jgi:hypothetical protein
VENWLCSSLSEKSCFNLTRLCILVFTMHDLTMSHELKTTGGDDDSSSARILLPCLND